MTTPLLNVLRVATLAATFACCSSSEHPPGKVDLFWWRDMPVYQKDLMPGPHIDIRQGDGPTPSQASIIGPVVVSGDSSCEEKWKDTATKASGSSCEAHLQSLQLGVGLGAEPDKYGCKIGPDGSTVQSIVYEIGCDDEKLISLSCDGSCDGQGVERGSLLVTGAEICSNGWMPTGKNIGQGRNCQAFVGYVQLGVGIGAEPSSYGCRYAETSGDIEVYLYEEGCDDRGLISIRCDWVCSTNSSASKGTATLEGKSNQCKAPASGGATAAWQQAGTGPGPGKACIAGIEYMRIGVGSGPEPDLYGCRYDAQSGQIEAELYEVDCDDKDIKVDCGYFCF
jgi:hypothetical protein